MTCRTWWIIASFAFLVGMIMGGISTIFSGAALATYFALLNVCFVIAGWVLWGIGLVSHLRNR